LGLVMTGQSRWISRIYRSTIPVTAPLSSSVLCAQSLTVHTKFQHKPAQGWLPETHTYLTLTYKLTLNTRHTAHQITKCWMTINKSQTVYCTSLPDCNLSLLSAVSRSLQTWELHGKLFWPISDFYKNTASGMQPYSPVTLYMPVWIRTNLNTARCWNLPVSSVYWTASFLNYGFHTRSFPNLNALRFLMFQQCIKNNLTSSYNTQNILIPISTHALYLTKHALYEMEI
jgi:hypothetical protein